MTTRYEGNLTIPAITLCNLNPYNRTAVFLKKDSPIQRLLIEGILSNSDPPEIQRFVLAHYGLNLDDWTMRDRTTEFPNLTDAFLKAAHTKQASILGAFNLATRQQVMDKISITPTDLGFCFLYQNDKHVIFEAGAQAGLELYLNIHTEEYMINEYDGLEEGFKVCNYTYLATTLP